jgi:hypothetical protein
MIKHPETCKSLRLPSKLQMAQVSENGVGTPEPDESEFQHQALHDCPFLHNRLKNKRFRP